MMQLLKAAQSLDLPDWWIVRWRSKESRKMKRLFWLLPLSIQAWWRQQK